MGGMRMMTMSQMRMMRSLLMISRRVMFGGFAVVTRCVLVVFCSVMMLFAGFFGHSIQVPSRGSQTCDVKSMPTSQQVPEQQMNP
jgi:hypothetical protein